MGTRTYEKNKLRVEEVGVYPKCKVQTELLVTLSNQAERSSSISPVNKLSKYSEETEGSIDVLSDGETEIL